MVLFGLNKRCIGLVLIATLLGALGWAVTGCADFEQWEPPPQPPEKQSEVEKTFTKVETEDKAVLTVYEHLLSQAESYKAKAYLADFYTACDKWSAESELFQDGTSIWHVVVDMTDVGKWEERTYWQKASWIILQDGKVIPSNRFQANALRIEADLQELSLIPQS